MKVRLKINPDKNFYKNFYKNWGLLIAITAVGAALRLFNIGRESFWLDETFTYHYVVRPFSEIPSALARFSVHPPLYFYLVKLWSFIAGLSEAALRQPSFFFGTLSLPLFYSLAAKVFRKETALWAVLLLALSPFHIYYSQEARPYALLGFLALAAFRLYIDLLQNAKEKPATTPTKTQTILFIVVLTALAYTHIYGLVAIATLSAHLFYLKFFKAKKEAAIPARYWFFCHGILLLLFLPWVLALFKQIGNHFFWSWIPEPSFAGFAAVFANFAHYSWPLFSLLMTAIVFFIALMYRKRLPKNYQPQAVSLLWWLFFPLIFPIVVSLFYKPVFFDRYTIQALFFFLLLTACGIDVAIGSLKRFQNVAKITLAILLLAASVFPLYQLNTMHLRRDMHALMRDFVPSLTPKDLLMFIPNYFSNNFTFYTKQDYTVLTMMLYNSKLCILKPNSLSCDNSRQEDISRSFHRIVAIAVKPLVRLKFIDNVSFSELGWAMREHYRFKEEIKSIEGLQIGIFENVAIFPARNDPKNNSSSGVKSIELKDNR